MSHFIRSNRLLALSRLFKEPTLVRHYQQRNVRPTLFDFNERQARINTSKRLLEQNEYTRRSLFADWNYDVELFALGARLREFFEPELLRESLRDPTFHLVPEKEQIHFSLKDSAECNVRLAENGEGILRLYLRNFCKGAFPKVPSDGVDAFTEYLLSDKVLAFVALHIGFKDLIVSEDYPPTKESLAKAFCAFIGAHAESGNDSSKTHQLVVDLLATQLVGVDLHDIWRIQEPMSRLRGILEESENGTLEPRLQWVSGKNTILASYHVGIYWNRNLIGECTGESVEIATEMAALDALRRIFDTDLSKRRLELSQLPSLES